MTYTKKTPDDMLRALDAELPDARMARQRRRLRVAVERPHSSFAGVGLLGATGAIAAMAIVVRIGMAPPPEPQAARDGASGLPVRAPHAASLAPHAASLAAPTLEPTAPPTDEPTAPPAPALQRIALARGISMGVTEHARARGRRVGRGRYEVKLREGTVELGAEPTSVARAAWVVLAGQYRIRATDAVFSVDYDPSAGSLHVTVSEGTARITGPRGGVQKVEAGNTLRASRGGLERSTARHLGAASSRTGAPSGPGDAPNWHDLYEEGRYAAALDRARQEGLTTAGAASLDAQALTQLADAARLARAPSEARALLLTLRERHPTSTGAAAAAFLLGRLASDRPGHTDDAERWFHTYLRETPSGLYAQEALGRLLTLESGHGPTGAVPLAKAYLARFPGGPYAPLARTLAQ